MAPSFLTHLCLAVIVIPKWMVMPLIVVIALAIILGAVVAISKFGVNSKKLKEAGTSVELGEFGKALAIYKEVARSSVASTEFKILPGDKSVFDKAMAGMQHVYGAAGRTVDLEPIVELHSEWQDLNRRQRRSATKDYSDGMQQIRREARALIKRLPKVSGGQSATPSPRRADSPSGNGAIRVECGCGRVIKAKSEFAGRRVKCPDCGEIVEVPFD